MHFLHQPGSQIPFCPTGDRSERGQGGKMKDPGNKAVPTLLLIET